ncbi:FAD/NAD(P)-binding domain-containing protein [Delitschia confertaspora ATCC 74209]|uniref:FAD/NAD(P)-binding domain-containing protein n=1 Tax=Delitschia confertaspora ATCC 74209 TaxID=1513339 RepID=A0A9P4JN16_9PLEO|nr:FAD/NAD(P)-binding domain-containing protein [Delitschia confertaspora ATCC 74209]
MNGHLQNGSEAPRPNEYDVVIIGAGISGINATYRVQTTLPDATYTILEGREHWGGTWDLFKYPGIRSDSDLFTFGFPFNPWSKPNPIATGESIVEYIGATARKFGIDKHIQFRHKVRSANWSSDEQRWVLEVENEGQTKVVRGKFVILGTGYYNYDKPLEADIPGLGNFQGTRIHPQFWPTDLDYTGKKMVIIGSGATAITLLPALVDKAAKVTMLQRSPSYILSLPQRKATDPKTWSERLFPTWLSLKLTRWFFITQAYLFYVFSRKFPKLAKRVLLGGAKKQLPKDFPMDPHFNPRYNVWDQRVCLCPDGDFFEAFKKGNAEIVTGKIKTVTSSGIELENGDKVPADIIITATGLNLEIGGKIALTIDKAPVNIASKFMWHATMLTGVPNLALIIGYTNAPWTLGADACARLLTRLMKFMKEKGYTSAIPEITEEEASKPMPALNMTSTYIEKALDRLPRGAAVAPWLPRDNYFKDNWDAWFADLGKGMRFRSVST